MDYKGGSELWKHQWKLAQDPQKILFAWAQKEEEGAYKYTIADDYLQNKKVEIAYWKWQKDGAPKLSWKEIEKKYFSITMNEYHYSLFHGIKTDNANLKARDKQSYNMFKLLIEEGYVDAEVLTALIKERHELAEYYRTSTSLIAFSDILMKYCTVLSIFSGPTALPSIGKVGSYIAKLTGIKGANLASKISVTYAELQPGQWLMRAGKLFMQGALVDASMQISVVTILEKDFYAAVENLDFADIAVMGAINMITGGGVSLRKLFGAGTKIAVIKGTTVVTLELTAASIDWKPFNGSEQYASLFNGDKDVQKFFCDFVLGISGNILPDEMLDVFKKWSKVDFDVRWYSTLTAIEKNKVRKIYNIIHSPTFKGALETNSTFVKAFLQNVINQNEIVIKTIKVEEFEYLPEKYIMPVDNTNVVIPGTNGY